MHYSDGDMLVSISSQFDRRQNFHVTNTNQRLRVETQDKTRQTCTAPLCHVSRSLDPWTAKSSGAQRLANVHFTFLKKLAESHSVTKQRVGRMGAVRVAHTCAARLSSSKTAPMAEAELRADDLRCCRAYVDHPRPRGSCGPPTQRAALAVSPWCTPPSALTGLHGR